MSMWNPNSGKCVNLCPDETPASQIDSNACAACSEVYNRSSYWNGSACAYCPESTPNWNTYTQKCDDACPDATPAWDQHICTLCDIAHPDVLTPFWNPSAGKCVAVCPSKQYTEQETG